MSSIDQIIAERHQREKFLAWTAKVNKRTPELAQRVFDLRGNSTKLISLEAQLGRVLTALNSSGKFFATPGERIADQVLTELLVEELFREVNLLEQTIKKNSR